MRPTKLVGCTILLVACSLFVVNAQAAASYLEEKRLAVELATKARARIGTGLLGEEYTETTTSVGHKDAKILAMAPDFPALLVQWLHDAGIGEGKVVAVNASGSFPGLLVAALSAVEAVKARPLLITSLGASSWGANRPDFTWAHMETLVRNAHPTWKSLATSLGGDGDRAFGLSTEGRQALLDAVRHAGNTLLMPESDEAAVTERMRLWTQHNSGQLPDLLINIGGNLAFFGVGDTNALTGDGLLLPAESRPCGDGVGKLFHEAGKPVVHLLEIRKIAARNGITLPSATDPRH